MKSDSIKDTLTFKYINDKCSISSLLNNECKIISNLSEQNEDFILDFISKIKDGSLEQLITSVVYDNKNIIIENEDEIYSISTKENQNFN